MSARLAISHSNHFKVKDEPAFRAWAESIQLNVMEENVDGEKHFALYRDLIGDDSDSSWPSESFDEDEEPTAIDFRQELCGHIQEGSIVILLEFWIDRSGFNGRAEAMDSRGGYFSVNLQDIYNLAKTLHGTFQHLGGAGLWKQRRNYED